MLDHKLFLTFLKPLNTTRIRYCVTGSVAGIIYGEPRLTHDIDIVLEIQDKDVLLLKNAFPEQNFYLPPEDIIFIEKKREERGHMIIIHNKSGFKADIYFTGKDPLSQWAVQNSLSIDYEGNSVSIARPEYVIVRKLEYYREGNIQKHLQDIAGILEHSSDLIDFKLLEKFTGRYLLDKEWEMAKGK